MVARENEMETKQAQDEAGSIDMPALQQVAIDALVPYARNARVHSDEQVAQIAASIREFGFTNPVLVDAEGGIIAGHGRVLAARRLGMREVPAIRVDYMSEAQKRAYIIADNKLALNAGWDDELLALELGELGDLGLDLALTGFSEDELAELHIGIEDEVEGLTDEDESPGIEECAVTAPGDLWILGRHRLLCGDSTSLDALQQLVAGEQVDLLLTDPPYNLAYEGRTKDALSIQNDEMDGAQFRQFLRDAFTAADMVMRAGAAFYIWHSESEGYNFRGATSDAGWTVRQCLIWKKHKLVMGRQDYQWKHEPCLYGWKEGAAHLWTSDRKQTTILEFERPGRNGEHPTMKPVALFEYQMLNSTRSGDVVLDLFGGSGTTIIAAEKHGRCARVLELDPRYCDVIIRRWQAFSGQQAVLEASGQTFDDLAAARAPSDASG